MKPIAASISLLLFVSCATTPAPQPAAQTQQSQSAADPYLWLENIDDPRALAWVAEQNERTRRELASTPGFAEMQQQALDVLRSSSRIPDVEYHGRYLYTLWKDAAHPRGVYRRTTVDELREQSPEWTTVLDIDEMSRRDGRPWVFKGMECLQPQERRCLVSLSPGGGDAIEIRELDTETLQFVPDGFVVPLAKSYVDWVDENTLILSTDFGPDSLTEAGYPRIVKLWKRGTPLSSATTVYRANPKSSWARPRRVSSADASFVFIEDAPTFWTKRWFEMVGSYPKPFEISETADIEGAYQGRLVLTLQDAWRDFPAGSVVIIDPGNFAGEVLAAPTADSIVDLSGVEVTDRGIFVPMLENVRGRLVRIARENSRWVRQTIALPDNGALSVMTTDGDSGAALVKFETFITPPAMYYVEPGNPTPSLVRQQEATFDGSRFEVTQQWATSADGTRVPYFLVGAKGFPRDGSNPTHIFSYGGFRSSLVPSYSGSYEPHQGAYGRLWLERGGVFVLANIRGGGEFGPAWHSSVLKANRHKAFEDFEAVAADLVRTNVTTASRLAIEGRSNGGLLTLATMIRRPELYGAVISGAPLSDMRRYHEMLAGASWIAEYGDPREPDQWAYLSKYSPYQNFSATAKYPPLFVYASTRDDRVHPGHARKTVAKLQAQGHPVWYFENVEGGHGGSVTHEQLAYRIALSYAHLWRSLGR